MSDKKLYKKLPGVLHTTAIKNFFENTVEQLFSKANVETIQGYIGSPSSDDVGTSGSFLREPTVTRRFYGLTPTVNTINTTTGDSENLVFYDELIDTLATYGVDPKDHNKIFSENYATFVPPVDPDKLINYAEYYWSPTAPTPIKVTGTLATPIDIDRDVIGKSSFTPPGGKTFRSGMVIEFTGEYVIPQTKVGIKYIVAGAGEEIQLLLLHDNYSTRFTSIGDSEFDIGSLDDDGTTTQHAGGGEVTALQIINAGVGYIAPQLLIYDDVISNNGALVSSYPSLEVDGSVALEQVVANVTVNHTIAEYNTAAAVYTSYRTGSLATANISVSAAGSLSATVDGVDVGENYFGEVKVALYDVEVLHDANTTAMGSGIVHTNTIVLSTDTANVLVGQSVTGFVSGIVTEIIERDDPQNIPPQIVLEEIKEIDLTAFASSPELRFAGRNFDAVAVVPVFNTITPGAVTVNNTQAIVGVNPNDSGDFYLLGGINGWDKDFDGDGIGDVIYGGAAVSADPDYILQERGAINRNTWSRVNFWFHKDNFLDAGDELPNREYRANRPILEFSKYLELYNHGKTSIGSVISASTDNTYAELDGSAPGTTIDGSPMENSTFIFPGEVTDIAKYVYTAVQEGEGELAVLRIKRVGDPVLNPADTVDGDNLFVPLEAKIDQTVQIANGLYNIGKEYVWRGTEWQLAQEKLDRNQPPLFNLYDINGVYLGDDAVFPENTFAGNKLFGFAEIAPAQLPNTVLSTTNDSVLGFPLVYRQFKSSSEILFENYQNTGVYQYTPLGATAQSEYTGYAYYKLNKQDPEFHSYWRIIDEPSIQRIFTTYNYSRADQDSETRSFSIGCIPAADSSKNSGYDIEVRINAQAVTGFTYGTNKSGFIDFDVTTPLVAGDFIEINAYAPQGLLSTSSNSKFEIPLSYDHNPENADVDYISEPEYLPQISKVIGRQPGFAGDVLGANNYSSTEKNPRFATEIIQTNQDVVLGALLLDDQPHNIVDALRFNANEYIKYKNRVKSEIDKFYQNRYTEGATVQSMVEEVLKNVISFKVGREVFNRTYVLPFGDTYEKETFVAALAQTQFVLSTYADLDQLENSVLIYKNNSLLTVDRDYVISSFSPITIDILPVVNLQAGDNIVVMYYDAERDSAQCPPTPSTMGLYPLFQPEITVDDTFQTPITVVVGHDGSLTPALGDVRDDILLAIETRIFNAAKREFRDANSLPEYNETIVRGGAFRDTGYTHNEFYDLLRHHYSLWTTVNNVDTIVNEFYDPADEWTWNYGDASLPGHWRGIYEYYYDTDQPHTKPWEMLGFTEKPLWWDEEYYQYTIDDLGRENPYVDYSNTNEHMWSDLEQGIIRQGPRENVQNSRYLTNNPYRRVGLHEIIPVDANAELISPYRLFSTGSTSMNLVWANSDTGNHDPDYEFRTTSFLDINGVNVSYDSSNVYVESQALVNHVIDESLENVAGHLQLYGNAIEQQQISYNIPRKNLNIVSELPTPMVKFGATAILVNGLPLYNIDYGRTWANQGEWHYDQVRTETDLNLGHIEAEDGLVHYHTITPKIVGLDEWDTESHSTVVGWAFDGLPIYGPYGYADPDDAASDIVQIKSPWVLRDDVRLSGPGGAYTGVFIQDYTLDSTLEGTPINGFADGYVNRYNLRYAKTPDSPTQKIWHYAVTLDADQQPAFPYHVGGGLVGEGLWAGNYYNTTSPVGQIGLVRVIDQGGLYTAANTSITITGDGTGATAVPIIEAGKITGVTLTDVGQDYTTATATVTGDGVRARLGVIISVLDNSRNHGYVNAAATASTISTSSYDKRTTDAIAHQWKFGDLSPVEHAWTVTEGYPFAVAEALALAKPGRFATIFGDPTLLFRPAVNKKQLFNKNTNKRWQYLDPDQFRIHGDVTSSGEFISNIGYTQFIHSWLTFQGLDTSLEFAQKLRTLNVKLAHRMAGFIDKDTMTLRTDQYSSTGNATSLIVPKENIDVSLHTSNYKTRNFYSGVIIEKSPGGYRLRGFDKTRGYFNSLDMDRRTGGTDRITVGGDPAEYQMWTPNRTYKKGSIIDHLGRFYAAPANLSVGDTFDKSLWTPLAKLPQIGGATATLYRKSTDSVVRVNYEHEYTTVQEVYDILLGIGRYNESEGFEFGEYDTEIADVRNWQYAAKQFLFWTTGRWEVGNTLELSPMATKVRFSAPRGFIAKINRIDREQFGIVNHAGALINAQDCEIIREDDYIEVIPPADEQIYGLMLFTKELEHALVVDNVTEFNDVLFDPVISQRHGRLKIKASRTRNWKGKFLSQGFIIDGDELLPNLDNLAEGLGRYHELGYVPVEKQVYEASRALFGFEQKDYLRELDIVDDEQFDFYKGMIQNKGTTTSLSRIARSSAVVQGNITVFDEWALRVGDFGDTDKNHNIEIKLNKSELTQDPQLVTLQTPISITHQVSRVDVAEARYVYSQTPFIQLPSPGTASGVRATADAVLAANGTLAAVVVTNPGSGYTTTSGYGSIDARVLVSNVVLSGRDTALGYGIASLSGTGFVDLNTASTQIELADNISDSGNVRLTITPETGNTITMADIVSTINSNASLNVNITAQSISSDAGSSLFLYGKDFTVVDGANVALTAGRYQPVQRYDITTSVPLSQQSITSYETVASDILVTLNDSVLLNQDLDANGNVVATNWTFESGKILDLTPAQNYPLVDTSATRTEGNVYFPVVDTVANISLGDTISADNLVRNPDASYKFLDVYINGVLLTNSVDSIDTTDGSIVDYGTMYTFITDMSGDATAISFPDISRLPSSVLTTTFNPPVGYDAGTSQRQIVRSITPDSEIRVVVRSAVQFDTSYEQDLPGKELKIRVYAQDGISVKLAPARTYEITQDLKNDNLILIDIDDSDRFLKKPLGVSNESLWPTTSKVNATGVLDPVYPTIRNSGYVNSSNVTFQSFDLSSLPDLFSDDILIKPSTGDLLHVAIAENYDWNVYKLQATAGTQSFLFRNSETGTVSLYTDHSLINYLDSNMIGEQNTGKYLDYFLTLKNSSVSDNVVIWRNEDIVQATQFNLVDFKAPRMIEARIKSIGPRNLAGISNVEPASGDRYVGISLTPVNNSNTVIVQGSNFTKLRDQDYISLTDRVGTEYTYNASIASVSASNVMTFNVAHVSNIVVNNGGSGYTDVPTISIAASPELANAEAIATVTGGISSISVTDTGDFQYASIVISGGGGTGAQATTEIVNAQVIGYIIDNPGSNYSNASLPTVTVTGSGTGATAVITDADLGAGGEILAVRPLTLGSGFDYNNVSATVSASPGGTTATVTPVLLGNLTVIMQAEGSGYTSRPVITIEGDGESATATASMNATVTAVQITNAGSGYDYSSPPAVAVLGANTSPASVTLTMASGVTEIVDKIAESGSAKIRMDATANANLQYRVTPALSSEEEATLANVNAALRKSYVVSTVDASYGSFTIQDELFQDDTVVSNIDAAGYSITRFNRYGSDTKYQITNLTPTSFEIERANTIASTGVSVTHFNSSNVITTDSHNFRTGDVVRIYTNTFNGMYDIKSTTANSMIISAPYLPGFTDGDIISEGLVIKTIGAHGISSMYASSNKRVAVHFAEPLYYNKVYPVSQVGTDTITINDYWPKDRQTHVFYEEKQGMLNGSVPFEFGNISADFANATNVISITAGQRLRDSLAMYNSNSEVLSESAITFSGNMAIIDPAALPGNTAVSVGITVIREMPRMLNRYPVLTTMDHGKVMLNGSTINVDSYNNHKAVTTSINRAIELRDQFISNNTKNFGLKIAMLKDPNKQVSQGRSAGEISDYGPYIRDPELINSLSDGQLLATGNLVVSDPGEEIVDTEFNQGSLVVGPDKGLSYTDQTTGIKYVWSPALNEYRPLFLKDVFGTTVTVGNNDDTGSGDPEDPPAAPEYHVSATDEMYIPDWVSTDLANLDPVIDAYVSVAYRTGTIVEYQDQYWRALDNIVLAQNGTFQSDLWERIVNQVDLVEYYSQWLILRAVPGTGTNSTVQLGKKQSSYNMTSSTTYTVNSVPVTMPSYRLMPNRNNSYRVYQAAQNTDEDLYYILLDDSSAPAITHDYYSTVSKYSDFLGYPTTDYYYINDIRPTLSGGQIADVKDPIRLQNTGGVLSILPVEPAAYIGKQLVPEPFAIAAGNNTDAEQNIFALPDTRFYSAAAGEPVRVEPLASGYDEFLMWTPGLTPGEWKPTAAGPGIVWGYGSGYYSAGDGHLPADYPVINGAGWSSPQPRLAYSKKFSVYPEVTNYDVVIYRDQNGDILSESEYEAILDSGEGDTVTTETVSPVFVESTNEDTDNQGLRPEEVFVACFWTELHIYRNQLIDWNFNELDANGLPKPIYGDYSGTVTKVKYIRLTELPATAMTRRLIPDTGWAGRSWNNRVIDNVDFSTSTDDNIWDIFRPQSQTSGSTGDDTERPRPTISIGQASTTGASVVVDATGALRKDITNPDTVPVTEVGPVLTGAFLDTLAGPCLPVPQPNDPMPYNSGVGDCFQGQSYRVFVPITNQSNRFILNVDGLGDNSLVGFVVTKIAKQKPFRAFFHMPPTNPLDVDSLGIVLVQSDTELPLDGDATTRDTWWSNVKFLKDTRWDGRTASETGQQIQQYGTDTIASTGRNGVLTQLDEVNTYLGITSDTDILPVTNAEASLDPTSIQFRNYAVGNGLSTQGTGFIQELVDCSNGEYVYVFVASSAPGGSSDTLRTDAAWSICLDFETQIEMPPESTDSEPTCTFAGSRDYQSGAVWREFDGRRAMVDEGGENVSRGRMDNIYFPYNPPSVIRGTYGGTVYNSTHLNDKHWANGPDMVEFPKRIVTGVTGYTSTRMNGRNREQRTVEITGYFRAPFTGTYRFSGSADDMLWVWLSSSYHGFVDSTIDYDPGQWYAEDEYRDANAGQYVFATQPQSRAIGGSYYLRKGVPDSVAPEEEYFTRHGCRVQDLTPDFADTSPWMQSKDYHRDNAVFRGGWLTNQDSGRRTTSDVSVELNAGEYYFMRILYGNNKGPGVFKLDYLIQERGITGNVTFGGRSCPEDSPPAGDAVDQTGGSVDDDSGGSVDEGGQQVVQDDGGLTFGGGDAANTQQIAYENCIIGKGGSPLIGAGVVPTYDQVDCWYKAFGTFPANTTQSQKDQVLAENSTGNETGDTVVDQDTADDVNSGTDGTDGTDGTGGTGVTGVTCEAWEKYLEFNGGINVYNLDPVTVCQAVAAFVPTVPVPQQPTIPSIGSPAVTSPPTQVPDVRDGFVVFNGTQYQVPRGIQESEFIAALNLEINSIGGGGGGRGATDFLNFKLK